MLIRIRATFECDNCGNSFSVDIDPSHTAGCAMALAEEACRTSAGYEGPGDIGSDIENDKHLCGECELDTEP